MQKTPMLGSLLSLLLILFLASCTSKYMRKSTTDPPGDEPILLVHGFADVHWARWWDRLEYYLTQTGYPDERIHRMNLGKYPGTTVQHPRKYARGICRALQSFSKKTGENQIDIIAHSMGGLGSRWCIQELDGAQFVDDLITLGTPHQGVEGTYQGSSWAEYLFGYSPEGTEALEPNSTFIKTLNDEPLPDSVDFLAVWSIADYVYVLSEWNQDTNAYFPDHLVRQDNVQNLKLPFYEGHLDLISSKRVFKKYREHLD